MNAAFAWSSDAGVSVASLDVRYRMGVREGHGIKRVDAVAIASLRQKLHQHTKRREGG